MHNIIIGNGQVGKALIRNIPNCVHIKRKDLDFSNPELFTLQLKAIFDAGNIATVINSAAYTNVDMAETERELALNINAKCPEILAEHCNRHNIPLVHYSSDFVFDGAKTESYTENDQANPINYYGFTKKAGDEAILAKHNKAIILRVSWVYSIFMKNNFVHKIMELAETRPELTVIDDQLGAPCNALDIAKCTVNTLLSLPSWARIMGQKRREISIPEDKIWGIYNLAPHEFTNRYEFACEILKLAELYTEHQTISSIKRGKTDNTNAAAKRPLNSMLNSEKILANLGIQMPNWEDSLRNSFIQYSKRKC